MTPAQRAVLALKCCEKLLQVQQQQIIHGDISPTNFIVNLQANKIDVELIDFGNAKILNPGETQLVDQEPIGSEGYISQQARQGIFSFASDTYALRQVLIRDVGIFSELVDEGDTVEAMMTHLINDIETRMAQNKLTLDKDSKVAIAQIKSYLTTVKDSAIDEQIFAHVASAIHRYQQAAALFPSEHKKEVTAQLNSLLKILKSINNPEQYDFTQRQIMLVKLLEKVAKGGQKNFDHPTVINIVGAVIHDLGLKDYMNVINQAQLRSRQKVHSDDKPQKKKL